jgi:hypothetical protein
MHRMLALALVALLSCTFGAPAAAQTLPDCPNGMSITWTLQSFNVYLSAGPNDPNPPRVATIPSGTGLPYQWPCPTTPGVYYLWLSATDADGKEGNKGSVYGFTVGGVTPPPPIAAPLPPTALSIALTVLIWTDNSGNEDRFTVERAPSQCQPAGGPPTFGVLASVGPNVTTYTDPITTPGTYCYRVNASNAGGPSTGGPFGGYTNSAEKTIAAPSGFVIGATVQVNTALNQVLNVRSTPGVVTSPSNIVGTQPRLAKGVLVEGPVVVSGVTWWKLDYASGVDGWSSQSYLVVVQP